MNSQNLDRSPPGLSRHVSVWFRYRIASTAFLILALVFTSFPLFPTAYATEQTRTINPRSNDTANDAIPVTQVRVLMDSQPVADALVYRIPAGQQVGGTPLADENGLPLRTNQDGYLQGMGEVAIGDHLLALAPIASTDSYTMYATNGIPTVDGVESFEVTGSGVQELVVSPNHPLILFNLFLSLEWDASNDPTYLQQLAFNLRRTSEYLYDFTNGQVALGDVTISQNADDWIYSHIVVQASNNLRPYSAQGGVVITPTVDPQHSDIVYDVGQVAIGSTWNRYGDPGHNLGDDWSLVLAHELSHYLFFQDDVYLGLNAKKILIAVDTCIGSAMGDLYTDKRNTEFIADDTYWNANCAKTLANQTLGRNEWETLTIWYPELQPPASINDGPGILPFDVTAITIYDPITPTQALEDPTFYLDYQDRALSSSEARAYIVRDEYVVDVGSPVGGQNRVLARGAQPGDQLCVFDRAQYQYGCEVIELGDDRLTMKEDTSWTPLIQMSPVNSTTIDIQVSGIASGLSLHAQLYPEYGWGEAPITLTRRNGVYRGTFTLSEPVIAGNIRVWVDEPATETNPRREMMVGYGIGGNPGAHRTSRGAHRTSRGAQRIRDASLLSSDGKMLFFSDNPMVFEEGQYYTIQDMAGLPTLPPGRTPVGRAYNLVATPGTPLLNGSISFEYMGSDVYAAGADESALTIYYWNGSSWNALSSVRNPYYNLVSARSKGAGIYVLMSSVELPLEAAGWNLIAYPVKETRTVVDALKSIDGKYTMVYGYEATDTFNPWRVYIVGIPKWLQPIVNTLKEMEFGKGYFINAKTATTLYLAHDPTSTATAVAATDSLDTAAVLASMPQQVPATFYGVVGAGDAFVPTADMTVLALVDGVVCGQSTTQEGEGAIVYSVSVLADEGGSTTGCGAEGRTVTFQVGDHLLPTTATWDNSVATELNLQDSTQQTQVSYLPFMMW